MDGKNVLEMEVDERSKAGMFLAFQYPVEVPGVTLQNFLRTAYNSHKGENGTSKVNVLKFWGFLKMKTANARYSTSRSLTAISMTVSPAAKRNAPNNSANGRP